MRPLSLCRKSATWARRSSLALLMLLLWSGPAWAQSSGLYWYIDGIADYWFVQPDVFAFRCINGQAFTGSTDPNVVDSIYHHASRQDQAVEVYFSPSSTPSERLAEVQSILASGQVEMPYLTVTKDTLQPYGEEEWFVLDNLLLVNFAVPYPTSQQLSDFMSNYGLSLYSAPSGALPLNTDSVSYTYIFEIVLPSSTVSAEYFLDLAQDMIENDGDFVRNAEPNIVNFRLAPEANAAGPAFQGTLSEMHTCPTDDPYYSEMNNIENVGFNVPHAQQPQFPQFPGMPPGVAGADANICDCWAQGYHGTGITVGVIGSRDFCLTHPDMDNNFDPNLAWECTATGCSALVSSTTVTAISGMRMAGLIAAEANNQTGTVGVAPEATIVPYKIGNDYSSTGSLVKAIERALADQVDVLVTDFFNPVFSSGVANAMLQHFQDGRLDITSGISYGTVIIAPAGYSTTASGSTADFHPAATVVFDGDVVYEPISVIGSNRFDQLCTEELSPSSSLVYARPSHYGNQYDVAAPGPRIPAPKDLAGVGGAPTYAWDFRPHTGAISTVAGIAAMLLEKDPNQTAMEVRAKVIQGAEQVGGYAYPGGISVELGHGRVNCGNSLNLITTSISQRAEAQSLEVAYRADRWRISYAQPVQDGQLQLCNLMGQVLKTAQTVSAQGATDFVHTHLSPGLYLLQLRDSQGRLLGSRKVIKY